MGCQLTALFISTSFRINQITTPSNGTLRNQAPKFRESGRFQRKTNRFAFPAQRRIFLLKPIIYVACTLKFTTSPHITNHKFLENVKNVNSLLHEDERKRRSHAGCSDNQ